MLVHRSTESLVIERLDIPATESPSVERDSFIFLDEDYRELEHDELSPVKTRKITRTMGTLVLFFLQLPQGRVHIRVRHSWSEESLEENLPDDLWSWGMSFTKGPSRGTRPSLYLSLRALLLLSLSITIFFDIGDCPHWNTKRRKRVIKSDSISLRVDPTYLSYAISSLLDSSYPAKNGYFKHRLLYTPTKTYSVFSELRQ